MRALSLNQQRVLYRNLTIGGLGLLAVFAVVARVSDVPMHWPSTAVVIASLVISLLQFNTLDETAKQAHYIAWYWGALVALIAVMAAGVAVATGALPFAWIEGAVAQTLGEASARNAFLFGLIAAPGAMFVAFGVWWSVHWLRLQQGAGQ